MSLDETISAAKPAPRNRTWWYYLSKRNPEVAKQLEHLINGFVDGDPEVCAKVHSNTHLARIISIACEQHGVDITPEGARSWLRNTRRPGRPWV